VDHALQDGAPGLRLSSRRARSLLAACALAGAALASACSRTPSDPVQALLAELEAAAEARDAERFGQRLSPDFKADGAVSRADGVATLRRYFAGYENVALTVYGTEVERAGSSAHIRTVVEFSGRARKLGGLDGLLPPEAVYRFEMDAAEEAGLWRVRTCEWRAVEAGASPSSR
jgi:hypothetical protein